MLFDITLYRPLVLRIWGIIVIGLLLLFFILVGAIAVVNLSRVLYSTTWLNHTPEMYQPIQNGATNNWMKPSHIVNTTGTKRTAPV